MCLNVRHYLLALLVLLSGCVTEPEPLVENRNDIGYRPVYIPENEEEIAFLSPRTIRDPGRIYTYNNYLMVCDQNLGIHIFNNADPSSPVALGFLRIPGNTDMAIRNDILYADHFGNLLSIQLNEFNNLTVKGELPLKNWNLGVPPPRGFNFQCPDPSKGKIIDWVKIENKNLECYAL